MCLITFAWRVHPDFPLVVAANRDEFYHRAAAPARFWEDQPLVLAGRDLQAGGTWMGVTRSGRFAALTNFREPGVPPGQVSRGLLVSRFLEGTMRAEDYVQAVAEEGQLNSGFNLLAGDANGLYAFSNRGLAPLAVAPGVHGLSNHLLNTPWPKVEKARAGLQDLLAQPLREEALFSLMANEERAADDELPNTGVGLDMERVLSPLFIRSPNYGTRVSTVLKLGDRIHYHEQTFDRGVATERSSFSFERLAI